MEIADQSATSVDKVISDAIVAHSEIALESSPFFSAVKRQTIGIDALRAVFSQYRFWRDQFHTWFGVCIIKSGSCERAFVSEALLSLTHHVSEEIGDDHAGMYLDLLRKLGVSEAEARATAKSQVTARYERSFLDRFGTGTDNFADSVVALSGRELFASIRNAFLIEHLAPYGVQNDRWLIAHQELELDHFYDAIRPLLKEGANENELRRMIDLSTTEIDHHIRYWDMLLADAMRADA
jgi:hypothetical protein